MAGDLETIVELQQALRELGEAQRRFAGVPEWMQELHDEHTSHREDIEALQAGAEQAEMERRVAEAAVEDGQTKLNHYQQQIGQVSTQREYKALLKEIDTVKELINDYEEQALAALEQHEKAQTQLAEKQGSFQDLDERYRVEYKKWDEEKPAVESEIQRLEGRIEVLKNRVPRPLLSQFERLLERHDGEALAPIAKVQRSASDPHMWHCGICNYRVRPQVVVDIRNNGSLLQCDSCQRFLYLEDAPP